MRQSKAYQHFTRDSLLNLKVLRPNMLCCVVLCCVARTTFFVTCLCFQGSELQEYLKKMCFQSLKQAAWKNKFEYFQQESNLLPSGPSCLKG